MNRRRREPRTGLGPHPHRPIPSASDALWGLVLSQVLIDQDTGCWLWTGLRDRKGYGLVTIAGERGLRVHRVVLEWLAGPLGDLTVDHLCLRPGCLNPEHLEAVSRQENGRRGYVESRRRLADLHPPSDGRPPGRPRKLPRTRRTRPSAPAGLAERFVGEGRPRPCGCVMPKGTSLYRMVEGVLYHQRAVVRDQLVAQSDPRDVFWASCLSNLCIAPAHVQSGSDTELARFTRARQGRWVSVRGSCACNQEVAG